MKVTFGIFFLWLSITCISPSVKLVTAKNKIYKGRSPNVERYLNSCGREVDISGLIAPNLAAGARLAAKNESQALDEKTSRTYELRLIALEQFAAQNGDDAILFGPNKRPFLAATLQTFMRKYYFSAPI